MPLSRTALPALLVLLLLAAPWPTVSADLDVSTTAGRTFDIVTDGSTSVDAPRNLTLLHYPYRSGDVLYLDWDAPATPADGYTVYRVPGPGATVPQRTFTVGNGHTSAYDYLPGDAGTVVYFVTAQRSGGESVPSVPAATVDQYYPHCNVVSVYPSPPYYDEHLSCLFPVA
jgi:hypothetical protein